MKITLNNLKDVYKAKKSSVETMELKGYELIENLFVDSSGLGGEDELALTSGQFEKKLTGLLKVHGELTAVITGQGQFQVYVGLFKKTEKKTTRRVASNTLERVENGKRIIRLYDTDIITFEKNKITLNSGGFNTLTTTRRINEFLPEGFVYRKNWELYADYKGKTYKFENDQAVLTD